MSESFNESLDEIRELNRALGRLDEQERIIKLLEDYTPTFYKLSSNSDESMYPIKHLIALIKGEQK